MHWHASSSRVDAIVVECCRGNGASIGQVVSNSRSNLIIYTAVQNQYESKQTINLEGSSVSHHHYSYVLHNIQVETETPACILVHCSVEKPPAELRNFTVQP